MLEHLAPIHDRLETGTNQYPLSLISGIGSRTRELLEEEFEGDSRGFPLDRVVNQLRKDLDLDVKKKWSIGKKGYGAELLRSKSVLEFTDQLMKNGVSVSEYACSFVQASAILYRQMQSRDAINRLIKGEHPINELSLPGTGMKHHHGILGAHHQFLAHNSSFNYLRLIGAKPEVPYDELHQREMYLFTNAKSPTQFATKVVGYRNGPDNQVTLVKGKDVLELGAGNGADIDLFLKDEASSVTVVDGSSYMLQRLKSRFEPMGGRVQFPYDGEAMDMFDALGDYAAHKEKFDTICSHSSVHYFDDRRFEELLEKIHGCLRPNGHFAFAVKAPGATLDGNGIPLFDNSTTLQTTEKRHENRGEFVRGRMWLNYDGQTRIFRSAEAWKDLLSPYFDVVDLSISKVDNYEAPGTTQEFYNFVCKRKEDQQSSILTV